MSEINATDTRLIESLDDVLPLYTGAGKDNSRTGVETEITFFDPSAPDLAIMTREQNHDVRAATNASCGGDFARNEPTSDVLEVGSIAVCPKSLRVVLNNLNARIHCLSTKAQERGLKRSYFQHLPEKTAGELLRSVMDVPRYIAMWGPPRDDMTGEAAYFAVCKSNQVSVSYFDSDHLLANVRRLYALAPFLFMISENNAPFNEGQPFSNHAGMHHRASLKARGGVPAHLYTAQNGDEFLRAHIDAVMNNPLFFYYEQNGDYVRLPSGVFTTFNELRAKKLNTAANYFFAQSVLWPDIKIAALKDENGETNGHRYEARMFGVGLHQHQTMMLLVAALAYDANFAQAVDRLLLGSGFDLAHAESIKAPLDAAYSAAKNHGAKYLEVAYGTTTLQQFAHKFADLLEQCALMSDFPSELQPLLVILRTGWTDSKVNAAVFPTLDSALDYQRNYDAAIFKNPNQCAYTLFEKELKTKAALRA